MAKIEKEVTKEIPELSNPYNEEMVTIKLFKDNDKYKDDVFVGRNGMQYLIQRGVEVRVPVGIANILKRQEEVDASVATKIEEATARAAKV